MISESRNARTLQDTLEARLRLTYVTGAKRRARTPHRAPQSQPAKLFLVKGNKVAHKTPSAVRAQQPAWRHRHEPAAAVCQVLQMPVKLEPRQDHRLLAAMAAAGPLVWAGHALITWLKLF
jgi:hypothetical protein